VLHIGVEEDPVKLVGVLATTIDSPVQEVLRGSVPEYEFASFEDSRQCNDDCADVVRLARRILGCTEQSSRSVRVHLVQLSPYVHSAHSSDIRQNLLDWVKVELEEFREHLACEAVALIVDTFGAVAEVSWAAGLVEGCQLCGVSISDSQGTADLQRSEHLEFSEEIHEHTLWFGASD